MAQDIPPETENRLRSLLGDLIEGRWEKARGGNLTRAFAGAWMRT
jgi:hypothetical protein